MKKVASSVLLFLFGISHQAFASSGNANDGPQFALVLIGFLVLMAIFLTGVDFIQKNGQRILDNMLKYLKRKISNLKKYFRRIDSEYIDISFF